MQTSFSPYTKNNNDGGDKYKLPFLPLHNDITTRYVDGTPTSEVTPVTIQYLHPTHHGYP